MGETSTMLSLWKYSYSPLTPLPWYKSEKNLKIEN